MKNLLLIFAALLCLYLYVHPRVETRIETIPVAAPVVAAPLPTPRPVPVPTPEPKLYYHSPLDAPAMGSGYTANGYFSADPTTATGQHLSGSTNGSVSTYNGYYNPYYYPYGGTVNNTLIINNHPAPSATSVYPTPYPSNYVGRPRVVPPTTASRRTTSSALPRVSTQNY